MAEETPTIYEWAGGREAFARWLNRFYDLCQAAQRRRTAAQPRAEEAQRDRGKAGLDLVDETS